MSYVQQCLDWKPKAKERPRFRRAGNKVITYTPASTLRAEEALAAQWQEDPMTGPIDIDIDLYNDRVCVTIVEQVPYDDRKLRADIDNYAKLILDALNGVAFEDDSQIVSMSVSKN